MQIGKPSKLIGKVLSPALRLWLRSQVESAEELQIAIDGQDRQILKGYIPSVSLSSRRAVYQGLHLGDVQLMGENIRINIGQVIKGKPLQLLEPIQVTGEVRLAERDLQASLPSSLLASAFTDLLVLLLESKGMAEAREHLASYHIDWQAVTLQAGQFALTGKLVNGEGAAAPLRIQASLGLLNAQTLRIAPIEMAGLPLGDGELSELAVDLGTDVAIEQFSLDGGQLFCCGKLTVYN